MTGQNWFPNDRRRTRRKVKGTEKKVLLVVYYRRRPAKFLRWEVGYDWPSCNWRCAGEASGAGIEQLINEEGRRESKFLVRSK